MGLQEARDIIEHHMHELSTELCEEYSYEKAQLYEALLFAVGRLNLEIASYTNLP